MAREFRFGFSLRNAASASSVQNWARRAEDMGYDVLLVRDHLGAPAPFPTLAAAASAAESLHVGTFVLNAGFYNPTLLARDVATLRDLSAGRLELGLGAGSVQKEYEAADIAFPTPRQRVDNLRRLCEYLRQNVPDVPLLVGGNGDRLLETAAHHAQIIGLRGGDPSKGGDDPLAGRITFVRNAAGERFDELELNLAITAMPIDDAGVPVRAITRRSPPVPTDEHLPQGPGVLSGSTNDVADQIRRCHDTYGVTYFTVQQLHAEAFARVIGELR